MSAGAIETWSWECVHTVAHIPTTRSTENKKGEQVEEWIGTWHRRLFLVAENLPMHAPHSDYLRIVRRSRRTWECPRYTLTERKRLRRPWTKELYHSPDWSRVVEVSGRAQEWMTAEQTRQWLAGLLGERRGNAAQEALDTGPTTKKAVAEILLARYGGQAK